MSSALRRALAFALCCIFLPLFGCSSSHDVPGTDAGIMIRFDAELPPDGSTPGIDSGSDAGSGPPTMGAVGAACMADTDCTGGVCRTEIGPGGYCAQPCSTDAPCPDGADCVTVDPMRGISICLDHCEPGAMPRECRAGYGCTSSPTIGVTVCLEGCTDATDCPGGECDPMGGGLSSGVCFTPGAMIGSPCTMDASCESGGFCISEADSGWAGGSCIEGPCDPTSTGGCPGDAVCIPNGRSGICVDGCTTAMDCRAGLTCTADVTYPTRHYCGPGCTSDMQCTGGRICNTALGTCLDPFTPGALGQACGFDPADCTGGVCLNEFTVGFPGGYCVSAGCTVGTTPSGCPGDGVCHENRDGSTYCYDGCMTDANCRTGYACRPVSATSTDLACVPACASDAVCTGMGYTCNDGTGLCARAFDPAILGDPCTGTRSCRGGQCMTEGVDGWPAGMCTYPGCRLSGTGPSEMCPMGSVCVDDARAYPDIGTCVTACTVGMMGECRAGYACVALMTGGTEGACQPACEATSCAAGRMCDMMTGLCVTTP